MHWKPFVGKVASFLARSALCGLGLTGAFALAAGAFLLMEAVGEGDAPDDRDLVSIISALVTLGVAVAVYGLWFVPTVWQKPYFADWISALPPQRRPAQPLTEEDRHKRILRVAGGATVPVLGLASGMAWEMGTVNTAWAGMGIYAAIAASSIICGLYFWVYLRAVENGSIALPQRKPLPNESFSLETAPVQAVAAPKGKRRPPARANQRQPDGSIDYAFASEDYQEWFDK